MIIPPASASVALVPIQIYKASYLIVPSCQGAGPDCRFSKWSHHRQSFSRCYISNPRGRLQNPVQRGCYVCNLFLLDDFSAPQFNGLVVLLPKLSFGNVAFLFAGTFHHPKQPFLSTFLWVFLNLFYQLSSSVALKIPKQAGGIFTLRPKNHVDVARHKTISEHLHTFFRPAMIDGLLQNRKINLSCKYVQPIDGGKAYEIGCGRVLKLVFSAHLLKIQKQWFFWSWFICC